MKKKIDMIKWKDDEWPDLDPHRTHWFVRIADPILMCNTIRVWAPVAVLLTDDLPSGFPAVSEGLTSFGHSKWHLSVSVLAHSIDGRS
jgi:hypothetical protein